jgi:hypothetical protein
MPDSTQPGSQRGAVFLSHAREDTASAQRIAEALRSNGVEVWFDQNELRGGDSWDAKIRLQIRECALFMPVISAHTQERHEGYFRRKWKLGAERTHDMAAGVAFVVPVAIDDTSEQAAIVPDEFLRIQWMRLAGALPTAQFVDQARRLLGSPLLGVVDLDQRHASRIAQACDFHRIGAGLQREEQRGIGAAGRQRECPGLCEGRAELRRRTRAGAPA